MRIAENTFGDRGFVVHQDLYSFFRITKCKVVLDRTVFSRIGEIYKSN